MATKKIEILENTLLKLLIRRGLEVDRLNIVLSEGELGYTTDTKKLYIGDGSTPGGILVSNRFLGSSSDHTAFTEAVGGDLAFDTTDNTLYVRTSIGWDPIGGVYEPGNDTITVDSNNFITVGTLSAGNVSSDLLGNSIELNNNRIALSGDRISTNNISTRNSNYLGLPSKLNINAVNYDWPAGGIGNNLFLRTDITGNLNWAPATAPSTFFFNSTGGPIPVGTIMPYVSANGAPYGWLLCNGQEVNGSAYPDLSAVIGESYGSSAPGVSFKVPNYINSALYGADSNPSTSTTFSIASGTNSALSAQGSLFIIKAIPDTLVNANITVTDGLTSVVNGADQTGVPVSPLSGDINIGLPIFFEDTQTINGGTSFDIDEFGRVTNVNLSSTSGNVFPAGEVTAPYGGNIYNETSPIVFFQQPVLLADTSIRTATDVFTITAFPYITDMNGTQIGSSRISPNAKNIIIDAATALNPSYAAIIVSAPNESLLIPNNNSGYTIGSNEFRVIHSHGYGSDVGSTQVFLPLSAATTGALQASFRIDHDSRCNGSFALRLIGYTT